MSMIKSLQGILKRIKAKIFFVILSAMLFCILLSCGRPRETEEIKKDHVVLRLQWKIQCQFAGYYTALEKGFYNESGLDVIIEEGGYGQNNISSIRNGLEQFGTKWMADLIAEGGEFISLANIMKSNGITLVSKKDKGINEVRDFAGKKLSTWFIGSEYQLYALLRAHGLSENDAAILNQKWDISQFFEDEVDVITAMVYNELLQIYRKGYGPDDINIFRYADYGLDFPGHCLFTSKDYYTSNRDICKRFIQASIKGWEYAISHPEEAVSIILKYDKKNELDYDMQLEQMKIISDLAAIDKYPLGLHIKDDLIKISDIYYEYDVIKDYPDIDNLFTNEFIKQ